VENHGKVLVEMLKREIPEREVFFVHGGTATEDRETIRKIMEKNENAIIVASYGTFSTGISIRRLHNIVFASPSKSRIRILQSIGRQLRLSEHKSLAKLYDLGDDLCWKSRKNHTFLHFMERLKIYESENFEFKTIKIDL
jgi:superfamily II DNA or RNA helicase